MDLLAFGVDLLCLVVFCGILEVSCQRQCPRLQKPWNGNLVGRCTRFVGSECQFNCREPYRLVGSRVRLCRSDRTWSGSTTACELSTGCNNNCGGDSTCPALYDLENGYTEGQCVPGVVSQTCAFRCHAGFELQGQARLTCLPNGQWSAFSPFCRSTSSAMCETFDILNGDADCVLEGGLTICRISCDPGFMLVGSSVITCSSSGAWNEQLPFCRRGSPEVTNICPTLVAPEGGRLVGSCIAANTGDTCQLVCISGYRPADTRVLVCQADGEWSTSLPRCLSSGCQDIVVPHGITSGSCTPGTPGQSCTVTCQQGFTLTGMSVLQCQSNGQWSSAVPTCTVRSCPPLQPPVFGGNSGSCNPGVVGQPCNFYCNTGYQLVGQSTLLCEGDGQWTGNPPQCTAGGCPAIGPPLNGVNTGSCSRAQVGQSCTFTCEPGFILVGQPVLFCQAGGFWSSSPPPQCLPAPQCPDLNPPPFGAIAGNCRQATAGQSCSFSCQAGFVLAGLSNLFCEAGGRWSSAVPICERISPNNCPSLNAPRNGFLLGTCAPGRIGETCVFTCDDNYVLQGQRTLTCGQDGQWSADIPYCESNSNQETGSCPILTPPPNGNFEECDNNVGGRCVVVCPHGFLRTGSRVRTCLASGMWTGYAPTCTQKVRYKTTYTYKMVPLWSLIFG